MVLGPVAGQLLALDPLRLPSRVGPRQRHPTAGAHAEAEVPLHPLVSLWVNAVDGREPFEQVLTAATQRLAGYPVVESLYRDYGEPWAQCPGLGGWPAVSRGC